MTVKYQTGDIEINVARKWNRDGNLVESYEFVNTGEKTPGAPLIRVQ